MSTNETTGETKRSRRGFLRATATGATVAGLGATATGTAAAQENNTFDGWMEGANNYDGEVADETGTDAVTIEVGAGDAGLAFGPAAVQVDPGTTITWEWTGQGGKHNVVEDGGGFKSGDTVQEAGTTFEQTFEEEAIHKYYCNPHQGAGMVGVVVVGEPETGGGHGEEGGLVFTPELKAMGAAIVLGVLSPIVFAIMLVLNRDDIDRADETGRADADLKRIE